MTTANMPTAATPRGNSIPGLDAEPPTQVLRGMGAVPPAPLPPDVYVPGYEILEVLGRGGMGVVYKARQRGLNRLVALKMVLAGKHAGPDELERFWREAEAVASLSHPNIVQVHEINQHDGTPYFTLEYVEGGTLAGRLRAGPLAPREAARLVEQLADAMQAAHDRQIVHRDLKPANILIADCGLRIADWKTDAGATPPASPRSGSQSAIRNPQSAMVPKITDFGVAKRLDEARGLTATGLAAGTPQYMAPEQAAGGGGAGDALAPAADIYSLGVILYECLTGRVPFDGSGPDVLRRVARETPSAPGRHRPGLPRDLETVCLKCLEKRPRQRYLSAADLAADLRRWQEGRAVNARPVGRVGHGRRWCRRNPIVAALLAGMFMALSSGMVSATSFALQSRRHAADATRIAAMLGAEKIVAEQNASEALVQEHFAKENERKARDSELKAKSAYAEAATRLEEARTARQAEAAAGARLRAQMYALKSNMAFGDFKAGQVATTRALLDEMAPRRPGDADPRGFEWWYLKQISDPAAKRQQFTERVVGLSPAAEPDTWDAGIGAALYTTTLKPGGNPYRPLAGGAFSQVAVHRATNRMAYAPYLEEAVFVADHATGEVRQKIPLPGRRARDKNQHVTALQFSPDGTRLALTVASPQFVNAPGYLVVWDVAAGTELRRFAPKQCGLSDVAFSADGTRLVFAGTCGDWHVWDAKTLEQIAEGRVPDNVNSLAAGRDGVIVLGGIRGKSYVVDTAAGKTLRTLFGHTGWVKPMALAPDGKTLATSAGDQSIRVWDIDTGENLRTWPGHGTETTALAFSAAGATLISGSDRGDVNIWDCRRDPGALVCEEPSNLGHDVFRLPGGRWLAADYWGRFRVLDDEARPSAPCAATPKDCNAFAWAVSPDGRRVAAGVSAARDPANRGVWLSAPDAPDTPPVRLPGVPPTVHHMAFSPDGKTLATIHRDGRLRLTDVVTQKEVAAFQAGGVDHNFVAFTADGKELITAAGQGLTVKRWTAAGKLVWQFTDTQELGRVSPDWGGFFVGMALSPDDKAVAIATIDREVWLLDAATGTLRTEDGSGARVRLRGHTSDIQRVAFDPTGTRLATAALDGTVRLWDAAHGHALLNLSGHSGPVYAVAFSADGTGVASTSHREIRVWDGRRAKWREDIKNISRQCRMQNVQAAVAADGAVRVTALFVNESATALTAPDWARVDDRVRAVALLKPPDAKAALPNTLQEAGRTRVGYTPFVTFDHLLPGEAIPVSMGFGAKDWPAGTYTLWFTHSHGGQYSGKESAPVEFVLPAGKK